MNIYVGNLAFTATEHDLRQLFEPYGVVETIRLITDRDTGRSKGFGFVEMPDSAAAKTAIAELNGTVVGCAALDVHGSHALLRSVAVASDLAALGVGTRGVNDLLKQARASGIASVYLLTTTASDWFPKFGFSVTTRDAVPAAIAGTVEFTSACPSSATVMGVNL